jgi:hypothetical protein
MKGGKRGEMAKKNNSMVMNLLAWVTGVLVSLSVGFAMIDGILAVRYIPEIVTMIAGYVVVITTLVGVVLAILKK